MELAGLFHARPDYTSTAVSQSHSPTWTHSQRSRSIPSCTKSN